MPSLLIEPYIAHGSPVQSSGWSSLIGIITAIVGNVLISFALNTQRYAHIRIDREYKDNKSSPAKSARKNLPKSLRNYGTAVEQEEVAEQRQRINEDATGTGADTGTNEYDDGKQQERRPSQHSQHSSERTLRPNENGSDKDEKEKKSYLRSPYWWAGIVMMTIGETGNFLAYGFAPASIVSPLGVVGLISNCLIAPLMLKERFRQQDFWGVLVAIGGAVTVVLSAKTSEKKLSPEGLWEEVKTWTFLLYVIITCVCIVSLVMASPRYGHRTILVNLGLVGLFGGYTALSTKGVASLFTTRTWHAFQYPILYVLILILVLSAILQIRYLNKALQNFDSTQVIPVQFVLFTLSVIIGSAVLYRDFERTDAEHVVKFVVGCLLTFGGVYLITSGRKQEDNQNESEDESETEGERIHLLDEERAPMRQHSRGPDYDGTYEPNYKLPSTPRQASSTSVTHSVPDIAVTPALESDSSHPPERTLSDWSTTSDPARPQTPLAQIHLPSSSHTPFFTPSTSQPGTRTVLERTTSSALAPSGTPPTHATPPTRPSARSSISRLSNFNLFPGPLLQPLSASLSGIIADRIIRGEGTPQEQRAALQRARSLREAQKMQSLTPDSDIENTASTDSLNVRRTQQTLRRTSDASPLLKRGPAIDALGASRTQPQARLRSMSATLGGLWDKTTGSRDRIHEIDSGPSRHSSRSRSRSRSRSSSISISRIDDNDDYDNDQITRAHTTT